MANVSTSGSTVSGYGIVFNVPSVDLGGFTEVILSKAVDDALIRKSDIVFVLEHDPRGGVLARSKFGKGTLGLKKDANGLFYSFDAPTSATGQGLVESLKRGDLDGSSFKFSVRPEDETWQKRINGSYLRTINKFDELFDISCVSRPAYQTSTAQARSADSEQWQDRYSSAERSGVPSIQSRQCAIAMELLGLSVNDEINGKEMSLFIKLLEARGVKIPNGHITEDELTQLRKDYRSKAIDLRPNIISDYKFDAEDQRLVDMTARFKREAADRERKR